MLSTAWVCALHQLVCVVLEPQYRLLGFIYPQPTVRPWEVQALSEMLAFVLDLARFGPQARRCGHRRISASECSFPHDSQFVTQKENVKLIGVVRCRCERYLRMMPKWVEPLVQTHQQIMFFRAQLREPSFISVPKPWTVVDRGHKKFTTFFGRSRLTPFLLGHFESLDL